jgi:hypothetical protein
MCVRQLGARLYPELLVKATPEPFEDIQGGILPPAPG